MRVARHPAEDPNARFKNMVGDEFSVKDPRTWHGTVLGAMEFAEAAPARLSAAAKRAEATLWRRLRKEHLTVMCESTKDLKTTPGFSQVFYSHTRMNQPVEALRRPTMTAVDNITNLRQRREAIVKQHADAENQQDVEATIATFHRPRYEVNGIPSDGEHAVRELLQGLMTGFPDFHGDITRLRHAEDAVLMEVTITGTHEGEWAGIPPTGRRMEVPVAAIFEFDEDRLLCEKVYLDFAAVLTQIGVPPAVG
jgi:steroid delta-isomerase-like uncharacterized protein